VTQSIVVNPPIVPTPAAPTPPIDFATHGAQLTEQASIGNIDTSTAAAETHLATIDTSTANGTTALAAINSSTAAASTTLTAIEAILSFGSYEVQHIASLAKASDITVTFAFGKATKFRVSNFDTTGPLLVKLGAISGTSDAAAARVGAAVSAIVPTVLEFPISTTAIHLYTGAASNTTVTVEAYK